MRVGDGQRFIPAGAGNTSYQRPPIHGMSVHPRWRGEHSRSRSAATLAAGSSPLARGTQLFQCRFHGSLRFIPAGAGNTAAPRSTGSALAVHPRWRGEHFSGACGASSAPRFIPAGAGNTRLPRHLGLQLPVHPRWRGEHPSAVGMKSKKCGSSPLARGTPAPLHMLAGHFRFIPAGAGNTLQRIDVGREIAVHPRWRGEHAGHADVGLGLLGSSPLARGTLPPTATR